MYSATVIQFLRKHVALYAISEVRISDNIPHISPAEFANFGLKLDCYCRMRSHYHRLDNGKAEVAVERYMKKYNKVGTREQKNAPYSGMKACAT